MKNSMWKKGLVLGIILLFVGASVIPSTVGIIEKKTTFIEINSRGYIQELIDNASTGDTIYISSGIYYENIVINKSISLVGEDKDTTIIDGGGSGDVIYVSADWVNITCFTIQNSGSYNSGIYSFGYNNIKINNNIISAGIFLDISDGSIITNNDCSGMFLYGDNLIVNNNNCSSGIELDTCYSSIITNNTCNGNNGNGIEIWSGNYIIFANNICKNNNGIGIYCIMGGSNITIINNTCTDNGHSGIKVEDVHNSIITNNTCTGNYYNGIIIDDYNSYNMITNNNCSNNNGDGIWLWSNNHNTIANNTCNSNNGAGIDGSDSFYNIFSNNICKNNNDGIYLDYSYHNNLTNSTCFGSNQNGIEFSDSNYNTIRGNNTIYHNNLINNTRNAYDGSTNTWYNSTLKEGNYYDDYTGIDDDGDGIGDTPYNISGGDNQDLYPLMSPYGSPIANFTYYASNRTFDGSSSYDIDGVIVLYEWDFDDGTTGQGKVVTHVYDESGTYNVTLTVTDDDGYHGSISKSVDIIGNYPPGEPIINGPLTGKAGTMYSYMFVSEDLNGDDVFYEINWGDGITDPWDGPHESNTIITIDHNWSEQGTYTIMARAKDVYDAIGDWGTLEVTMPRNKPFFYNSPILNWLVERFPLLQRLLIVLGVYVV